MRHPHSGRLRLICVGVVAVAAVGGCSRSGPQTSADCAAQVRADDVVYTSNGMTERQASRYGSAEQADCEDVGEDPAGSVFPDNPDKVTTWTFDGYPPAKVLGVRYDRGFLGVFIADSVPAEEAERLYAELALEEQQRPLIGP